MINTTEGKMDKGGQNDPNTSDKRPAPPMGSDGKQLGMSKEWVLEKAKQEAGFEIVSGRRRDPWNVKEEITFAGLILLIVATAAGFGIVAAEIYFANHPPVKQGE